MLVCVFSLVLLIAVYNTHLWKEPNKRKKPYAIKSTGRPKTWYHTVSPTPRGISLIGCQHTLGDITVAPGKAYSQNALSPQLAKWIHRTRNYCLAPNDSSLQVRKTATIFRSNAFENKRYTYFITSPFFCQEKLAGKNWQTCLVDLTKVFRSFLWLKFIAIDF